MTSLLLAHVSEPAQHEFLAWAVPRVRKSRDLEDVDVERARIERWHATLDRSLPTRLVPRFDRRFSVVEEETGGFPTYVITPRGLEPERTVLFVHGGAFMAPIDPFHVRYAARLATSLRARIVLPDYPLAPEHTWRDSFDADDRPGRAVVQGARRDGPVRRLGGRRATRWRWPWRCATVAARSRRGCCCTRRGST